jgi:hypothetical protein
VALSIAALTPFPALIAYFFGSDEGQPSVRRGGTVRPICARFPSAICLNSLCQAPSTNCFSVPLIVLWLAERRCVV